MADYLLATEGGDYIVTEGRDYLLLYSVDDGTNSDTHDGFRYSDYIKHLKHLKSVEDSILARRKKKLDDQLELHRQLRAKPQQNGIEQPPTIELSANKIAQVAVDVDRLNHELSVVVKEMAEYTAKLELMQREHEIEALAVLVLV